MKLPCFIFLIDTTLFLQGCKNSGRHHGGDKYGHRYQTLAAQETENVYTEMEAETELEDAVTTTTRLTVEYADSVLTVKWAMDQKLVTDDIHDFKIEIGKALVRGRYILDGYANSESTKHTFQRQMFAGGYIANIVARNKTGQKLAHTFMTIGFELRGVSENNWDGQPMTITRMISVSHTPQTTRVTWTIDEKHPQYNNIETFTVTVKRAGQKGRVATGLCSKSCTNVDLEGSLSPGYYMAKVNAMYPHPWGNSIRSMRLSAGFVVPQNHNMDE